MTPPNVVSASNDSELQSLAKKEAKLVINFYSGLQLGFQTGAAIISFPRVKFISVDIKKFPASATEYGVTTTPTVVCIHNGNKVDSWQGLDDFTNKIKRFDAAS